MNAISRILAVGAMIVSASTSQAGIFSEFQPDAAPGVDPSTQLFEISGMAGLSFSGSILSIDSDPLQAGRIERVLDVSGAFDANGLLVVEVADLQNPSFTVALVEGFTGMLGDDLDSDNDGLLDDLASLGTIHDALGIADSIDDESFLYGTQLGGQDFSFTGGEPGLVFRDASVGDWFAVSLPADGTILDINGNDVSGQRNFAGGDPLVSSFGVINPGAVAVPEPSTLTFFASMILVTGTRRRRS
tara:strand:+ start:780194 stop:780928 length:735 start_codon:yes stop_codon:yes gene_type:complete